MHQMRSCVSIKCCLNSATKGEQTFEGADTIVAKQHKEVCIIPEGLPYSLRTDNTAMYLINAISSFRIYCRPWYFQNL